MGVLTTYSSTEQSSKELTESTCLAPMESFVMTNPCSRSGRCVVTPLTAAVSCDTVDDANRISVCTKATVVPGMYGQVAPNCPGHHIPIMMLNKVVMCSKTQGLTSCTVRKVGSCLVPKNARRLHHDSGSKDLKFMMRFGTEQQKNSA